METTYCGKSCEDCTFKDVLRCPGCKSGPGRPWGTECDLAKCCKDKGHETCATCTYGASCGKLRSREEEPERRVRKRAYEAERREQEKERQRQTTERAAFLGKWLWLLFWLVIPGTAANIMTEETVVGWFPGLNLPGQILAALVSLIYGGILLKISCVNQRYKTSGICCFIGTGVSVLLLIISPGQTTPPWTLVFTIPALIVALVGEYYEYTAHADVVEEIAPALSEKWTILWKWYIRMNLGLLGSVLLALLIPVLGLLATLVTAIGTIVVAILKLVYLYRTAVAFRQHPKSPV